MLLISGHELSVPLMVKHFQVWWQDKSSLTFFPSISVYGGLYRGTCVDRKSATYSVFLRLVFYILH